MNSLFSQVSLFSSSILLKSARSIVGSSSINGISSNLPCKSSLIKYPDSIKSSNLGSSGLSRFGLIQCCYYSTKKVSTPRKRKSTATTVTEDVKDAFFAVRKGDIIGVYKSLSDCQAQVGSSVCDPPVSVFKGYSLPSEAEEHFVSRGLQNALYTIKATDLTDDLFGTLVPCPFQEPAASTGETSSKEIPQKRPPDATGSENLEPAASTGETSGKEIPQKRPPDATGSENLDADCNSLTCNVPSNKLPKLDNLSCDSQTCVLQFNGTSKRNPGPSGAGAVLRTLNGSLICKIRQGLGKATNNVAEYRSIILGLKKALELGYTSIRAMTDNELVCNQLQGLWKVKTENIVGLHAEATKLKNKFTSFQISLVSKEENKAADRQANLGVALAKGQIQEKLGSGVSILPSTKISE